MQHAKAEIITIGTELLLGQIVNTNSQWLSDQMAQQGIDVYYHTVVGDNHSRVESVFRLAQERSDIIIVSGGLGPTEDDMTREAFQHLTGMEMIEHPPAIEKIKNFFEKRQMAMTPNNYRQARVFKDSYVINNDVGMAPGMIVTYQKRTWVFLPGVPNELKHMMRTIVMPYFSNAIKQHMVIRSMILKFIGIGEAQLEHELIDMIKKQQNPTIAPLAQSDGLIIRLTAKDNSLEKVMQRLEETKQTIYSKVGNYIYGIDTETIEDKIVHMLKTQNKRIGAAESVTGGMFTNKLIDVQGASQICPGSVVTYDAQTKQNLLKIPAQVIKTEGVVSEACAIEMAKSVCHILQTDLGISFTGVAGPDSLEGQEVGTVYIAIYEVSGAYEVQKFIFHGERNEIRRRATLKGFELLFKFLNKDI